MSLRIAAYTIALDETHNVDRWARSVEEADYRVVADTGSADGTPERLEAAGVTVHRLAIRPWRFDDARNASLALLPAEVDVCVMLDMDNFMRPGWRAAVEAAWTPDATRLRHRMHMGLHADGTPVLDMVGDRIHARWNYRWRRAVHEHLVPAGAPQVYVDAPGCVMAEVQTHGKESRRSYLPLLALAAQEDPSDSQLWFWLGRELTWSGDTAKAAGVFKRYLSLPTSTWPPERAEAMLFLSRVEPDRRAAWLERAMLEAPNRREVWLEMAEHYHNQADWPNLYWAAGSGIRRGQRLDSYLDRGDAWGPRLHDLGALACWHLGLGRQSVELGAEALRLAPGDARLRANLDVFERDASRPSAAT